MDQKLDMILASATIGIFLAFGTFVGAYLGVANHAPAPSLSGFATESTIQLASSSIMVVGPQNVVTIFASNDSCANRIIGMPQQSATVMLSFSTLVTPSATVGFPIAASSTNQFKANDYGCPAIRASATASTTITRSEYIR